MSTIKKITLGALCALTLVILYEIADWNMNQHWIGTTRATEMVQSHWIPIEEDWSKLKWKFECGDGPRDYINVATDLGLFGTYETLKSGICWKNANVSIENAPQYVQKEIIPHLEKQGFTHIYIHEYGDENTEWSELSLGEMWVETDRMQTLKDGEGHLHIKVSIHVEPDENNQPSTNDSVLDITVTQSYFATLP